MKSLDIELVSGRNKQRPVSNGRRSLPFLCLVLIVQFVWLVGCKANLGRDEEEQKPNILLILADDLGYGELGCYGQKFIETPHIDSLAANGLRFTQHYSGSPVCAPSRCVLLTGKHTGHAYIRANDEWSERGEVWDFAKAVDDPGLEGQRPIPANTVTLPELLQQIGYVTGSTGKWGLGAPGTEGVPNRQGFDFFFGYNCQRQAHTYYPRHLWKNEEKVWLDNKLVVPGTKLPEGADPLDPASYIHFELTDYAPDLLLEEALEFIRANRERPFFLYYASPIPHVPLQAPRQWIEKYVEKLGDEEPYLGELGYFPQRYPRATYAAMVSYLDYQVGQLIEELKALSIYENTLIIFTSDNGPSSGGGSDSIFFRSAEPFRADRGWGKGSLREGGIRVPMIASWPGHVIPGRESAVPSAFYDLLPTLCDIAGAPIPDDVDGISLRATLEDAGKQEQHDFLYWEYPASGGQQAVRIGNWKGVRQNLLEGETETALYDLKSDPPEEQNVADTFPEIVAEIEKIMEREHIPSSLERFKIPVLDN